MRPKPPLKCPFCGHPVSKVIDSRDYPRFIRQQLAWLGGWFRERRCQKCSSRYTTEETITGTYPPSDSSSAHL